MLSYLKLLIDEDNLDEFPTRPGYEPVQDQWSNNMHRMQLASEHFNLNQATETSTKEYKKKLSVSKDMFTGSFSDGFRRIDVVLVMRASDEPNVEDIKAKYLANIVKIGLHIEVVAGVMSRHKKLFFVKIHAPDTVLEEYGNLFGVKSYFKNNRVDFITPKRTFIERIFAFTQVQHQREWIKIVRKSYREPLVYSNAERSLIVYKILLLLPFGNHVNYLGLNRLLKRRIILDAYALHDGPYFFLPKQDLSHVNARQILCYNWVGVKNISKVQPIDLIHEYFGSRIAFYFAFYGFYNQALAVAALVGIITTCLEIFDTTDEEFKRDTCEAKDDVWICPECEKFNVCPFMKLKDYCDAASLNIFLDNPFTVFFSIFVVLWATIFVIFWRRREHYWNWMWELDKHNAIYQRTIRPEFELDYSKVPVSRRTGIFKYYDSGIRKFTHILISKCILLICITGILFFIALSLLAKDQLRSTFSDNLKTKKQQFVFLALFQLAYTVTITIIEKFCKMVSYKLVNCENHRTHVAYERSIVVKVFGYTFAFTFPIILYIAWLKGICFLMPLRTGVHDTPRTLFYEEFTQWFQDLTIFRRNCGPFSCINELCVLLLTVLFVKQIVLRILSYITSLKTDYNQRFDKEKSGPVPCWEREYTLKPVTEELMLDKYNTLAQQFGLVTLFVAAFPLAPLLALLINVWDIRFHARLFSLSSRRPLLLRRSGLGTWTGVLVFVSFLAILSNAFTIVRDTRTILRLYYYTHFGNLTGYLNYTLVRFPTRFYNTTEFISEVRDYKGEIPEVCYFQGLLTDVENVEQDEKSIFLINFFYYDPLFTPRKDFSKIRFYETLFIYLYEHILVCVVVLLHYLIPSHPSELKETLLVEKKIKDTYLNRIEKNTSGPVKSLSKSN